MKISVITACLNSEQDIEQTIQSVIRQQNCSLEYIIVDGGSTDATLSIIQQYASSIDQVISEKDHGIYDAYNKGARLATGDVIYILNSDDHFYDDHVLEKITAVFEQNPQQIAVYGNVLQVNQRTGTRRVAGHELTWDRLRQGNMIPHQGLFVKTALFKKYDYFDDTFRIAGDFDFFAKVFKDYEQYTKYVNETIAIYKMEGISNTVRGRLLMNTEFRAVIAKYNETQQVQASLAPTDVNREYFKKWIELLLFQPEGCASAVLKHRGIQHVALFGSGDLAAYMQQDLQKSGIALQAFLDNNSATHTSLLNGVAIHSPEWLRTNNENVDAIIFAFEGNHDEAIKKQLSDMNISPLPLLISWKEVLDWNQ